MMPRVRRLRHAGISDRTLRIYKREVSQFLQFLELNCIDLPTSYDRLDHEVAEYINHLFQEGEALTKAGWLLSGIKRLYPRVRRELAISQQWYGNWVREHTPTRATPITWKLVQAFVGACLQAKLPRMAFLILIGFVFFLRTGELLSLHLGDVALDPHEGATVIRIAVSKTSPHAQQSVAHVDATFCSLLLSLRRSLSEGPLWPYSVSHFRRSLASLSAFFEVEHLRLVPYSLRRGGATHFYGVWGNLGFVMVRGRWRDARTARIYLDDARAVLISTSFSPRSSHLIASFRRVFFSFVSRCAKGQA